MEKCRSEAVWGGKGKPIGIAGQRAGSIRQMGKLGKQSIIDLDQLPTNMEMDRMDSFAMMHWPTINDHWADENCGSARTHSPVPGWLAIKKDDHLESDYAHTHALTQVSFHNTATWHTG